MIEAYSESVDVIAGAFIPFNNVTLKKGCTVELTGPSSIQFNKCGVYMVAVKGSTTEATTIQLYKDGVAQPQAQATGTEPSFVTLVQVPENNSCCPCSSPTICQVISEDATTFNSVNIVVTKVV